jgi:hypothetical protein
VIADELERAAMAYLVAALVASTAGAAAGGALADGGLTAVDTVPAALSTPMSDGGIGELSDENGIPLAGGNVFRLYRGHGTEERMLPCAIVSAQGGSDGGDLSGNETVKLQVDILLPASAVDTAAIVDIPAALRSASATLIDALQAEDLVTQLNAVRFDATRLTVIGVTDRSSDHSAEGRARVHTITIGLYCAGLDVS